MCFAKLYTLRDNVFCQTLYIKRLYHIVWRVRQTTNVGFGGEGVLKSHFPRNPAQKYFSYRNEKKRVGRDYYFFTLCFFFFNSTFFFENRKYENDFF